MENFVENENHTLADYQFKCRICTIKLEMGNSNIIIDEDKANFYAITGQKLRSNINFSTIICSICRRDLIFCVYFKNKVKEIQNYLNQKGEDCKNCSDSDEEVIVLEGYPTFSLNNFEDDELPESISELSEYEITDVLPTRLNDAPVVNQYKDLKIVASTFATIQKTINEGCDRKNPEPLKVDQYKPLIVDIDEINKKKKENKCKSVRKKYKPNKLSTKPEETLVLQNNTINVSHDIKSPEKFMKKGFPPISARRKSERNVNKKIAATIVPQETLKKIKVRAEPMLTRSKAKPEGPKKVVPFNIKDWMITPKPKKVIPKLEEQNVIPGIFVCPAPCFKIFGYKNNLYRHQREAHKPTVNSSTKIPPTVNSSTKTPPTVSSLTKTPPKIKEPTVKKSPEKLHECRTCNKFYESPTSLSNHQSNVHNKKLYCRYKQCKHFVYTKHNLKFHVALHRGFETNNNVEHICEHCGLVDEENVIKRHQKVHMPKLHCPICRQPFRILNSLEKHIKSEHKFTPDLFKKTLGGIRNRGRKNSIF